MPSEALLKREFAEFLVATNRIPPDVLETASGGNWTAREPIGRLALLHGLIEPSAIDEIVRRQQDANDLFGQTAIQMGLLTRDQLAALLAGQAVRGCAEVLEDLVLSGHLSLRAGIAALAEFLARQRITAAVLSEVSRI